MNAGDGNTSWARCLRISDVPAQVIILADGEGYLVDGDVGRCTTCLFSFLAPGPKGSGFVESRFATTVCRLQSFQN
eukprot:6202872-Pleurochrysis_carterae.AAC.1